MPCSRNFRVTDDVHVLIKGLTDQQLVVASASWTEVHDEISEFDVKLRVLCALSSSLYSISRCNFISCLSRVHQHYRQTDGIVVAVADRKVVTFG